MAITSQSKTNRRRGPLSKHQKNNEKKRSRNMLMRRKRDTKIEEHQIYTVAQTYTKKGESIPCVDFDYNTNTAHYQPKWWLYDTDPTTGVVKDINGLPEELWKSMCRPCSPIICGTRAQLMTL